MRVRILGLFVFVAAGAALASQNARSYSFAASWSPSATVAARITPPAGFARPSFAEGSFAQWLRNLPLKPGHPQVKLFDGQAKTNQTAQYAVVDIDTGTRDLQQCADAVMRLRAEYLRAAGRADDIAFNFTSGHRLAWADWRRGVRPRVNGNRVILQTTGPADDSTASFRQYLDTIFTYAGSQSLEREMEPAGNRPMTPGDVFIQGGFPGHAVIVVDVAVSTSGGRMFVLAQSYMPAQDIHILINPAASGRSPWYVDQRTYPLRTPEWTFPTGSLRRFR